MATELGAESIPPPFRISQSQAIRRFEAQLRCCSLSSVSENRTPVRPGRDVPISKVVRLMNGYSRRVAIFLTCCWSAQRVASATDEQDRAWDLNLFALMTSCVSRLPSRGSDSNRHVFGGLKHCVEGNGAEHV